MLLECEMTATERAAAKLKDQLIERFSATGLGYRVICLTGDHKRLVAGLQIDNQRPDDNVIELSGGLRLFIDPDSAATFGNRELDFKSGHEKGFLLREKKTESHRKRVHPSIHSSAQYQNG
jgi:Fe-S cluster assembly iron-binding protein IscA